MATIFSLDITHASLFLTYTEAKERAANPAAEHTSPANHADKPLFTSRV